MMMIMMLQMMMSGDDQPYEKKIPYLGEKKLFCRIQNFLQVN